MVALNCNSMKKQAAAIVRAEIIKALLLNDSTDVTAIARATGDQRVVEGVANLSESSSEEAVCALVRAIGKRWREVDAAPAEPPLLRVLVRAYWMPYRAAAKQRHRPGIFVLPEGKCP